MSRSIFGVMTDRAHRSEFLRRVQVPTYEHDPRSQCGKHCSRVAIGIVEFQDNGGVLTVARAQVTRRVLALNRIRLDPPTRGDEFIPRGNVSLSLSLSRS